MIENIYCDENKNPAQKDTREGSAFKRMPKNMRQIGQITGNKRVYVEDYVTTFIRKRMEGEEEEKAAVVLGYSWKENGILHIFVQGAIEIQDISIAREETFSNETWSQIYEDVKKYFEDLEVIGWYFAKPGLPLEKTEQIEKTHFYNFAGENKLLFLYDSQEKETVVYLCDKNKLQKQSGYYIYYEKNENMQTYMLGKQEKVEIENYDDNAAQKMRQIMQKKQNRNQQVQHRLVSILYAASTLLTVIILVVTATILNNYDQMKSMQKTLNVISSRVVNKRQESTSKNVSEKKREDKKTVPQKEKRAKKTISKTRTKKKQNIYTIKKGDTLQSISLKNYHSIHKIQKILKANQIKNKDKIFAGEKIILPE